MRPLSTRVSQSEGSGIRDVFDEVDRLRERGIDCISLAVGEPSFDPPAFVAQAAAERESSPAGMKYAPIKGIPELREAIRDYNRSVKHLDYDIEETQVTTGATLGIQQSIQALVDHGDEIIVCSPTFPAYALAACMCGGRAVDVPTRVEDAFHPRADAIERAITPHTKAIVINNPGNPTGAVITPAELADIAAVAIRHDLWVISDEVYHRYAYDGREVRSIATLPGMRERTIVLESCSKTYAMTGYRIGWMNGPRDVIDRTATTQEFATSSTNTAAQYAALAALRGPQDQIGAMLLDYGEKRREVIDGLAASPWIDLPVPEGAFYAFPCIRRTGMDADAFAMGLLREQHVAVVPGTAFGAAGKGFVRLSYAGDKDEIAEAMRRMVAFAQAHAPAGAGARARGRTDVGARASVIAVS